jgi:hypothetical protein
MTGSVVLNRFKPAEAVMRCLVRAQETLEEMASQEEVQFGIQDEFGLYWMELPVYVGKLEPSNKRARLIQVESTEGNFAFSVRQATSRNGSPARSAARSRARSPLG